MSGSFRTSANASFSELPKSTYDTSTVSSLFTPAMDSKDVGGSHGDPNHPPPPPPRLDSESRELEQTAMTT